MNGEDNVKKHRIYHMKMEGENGETCLWIKSIKNWLDDQKPGERHVTHEPPRRSYPAVTIVSGSE